MTIRTRTHAHLCTRTNAQTHKRTNARVHVRIHAYTGDPAQDSSNNDDALAPPPTMPTTADADTSVRVRVRL